jgi:putative oxidoreductase
MYNSLAKIGDCLQSFALLVIRLAWGFELVQSGYAHLTHAAKTAEFFQGLHIPFPLANVYLSGGTELVGGVLLMLGLFSRLVSIPLFFNFCVAYAMASRDAVVALVTLRDPAKFIDDSAFPFLVTSLIIFAFGPGRVSLDAWIRRKSASRR